MIFIKEQVDHFLRNQLSEEMLENELKIMTFSTPWAARTFGLTLAAVESGVFSLQDFQKSLINVISHAESSDKPIIADDDYYTCWLEAFTDILQQKSSFNSDNLVVAEQHAYDRLLAIQHDHEHHHDHACESKINFPDPVCVEKADEG